MTDSRPTSADDPDPGSDSDDPTESTVDAPASADDSPSDAELRARVEEKYDFEDFGPRDMAEMTPEEWDAAFDAETWITGDELLERVQVDLERRVATRDVFAVVERRDVDGEDAVLAFSDEGYALVRPDGSVEGFGTVLRDVKPTVALCSMDSYEPEEPPAGAVLPNPEEVPEGSGELGNFMLQVIAGVLGLSGVVLLGGAVFAPGAAGAGEIGRGLMVVFGLLFLAATFVLFFTVANARLSDKFRAEEYRERLRAIGLEDGERPAFLPTEDDEGTVETALDSPGEDDPDDGPVDAERAEETDPEMTGRGEGEREGDESSNPAT
ncbi:DUF7319 domain-containing protein [Halorubellus salinus]|uniref:DUF7319 domain-containing protein n=1 Tax=Halorubellus salinus TaxID=755309 RepID=UPI001D07D17A|nr:hypothetical protein [Halorubellus salinus]